MGRNTFERTRRTVLRALTGTGLLTGLAGCTSIDSDTDTTGTRNNSSTAESETVETATSESKTANETSTPAPSVTVEVDTTVEAGDGFQRLLVTGRVSATQGVDSLHITMADASTRYQADGRTESIFEAELHVRGGRRYEIEVTVTDTAGETFSRLFETDHVPIFIDPIETDRLVGAHYYPWYETGNHSDWTERTVSTPVLGEYAAGDASVIDQHLKWSLEHGVRWWSISWWGPDSPTDRVLTGPILGAEQFDRMQFSILYETVGRFKPFDFDLTDEQARTRLADDFEYLERTFFDRENYRRIDGRPVVYFYVSAALRGDVEQAFTEATSPLDTDPYILAGVPLGAAPGTAPIGAVADAVTSYNPYSDRENIEAVFHERYEHGMKVMHLGAAANDFDFVPVVIPGYNDTELPDSIREDNPILSASPDRFERVCDQVNPHLADAQSVLVTSFNEWYENTQIEPSEQHSNVYLAVTAEKLARGPSSGFDPPGKQIRFVFDETVQPSSVTPESSDHRELAFMATDLSLFSGTERAAEYDIGTPETEPLWLRGVFGPESHDGRTWRWWGGRSAETILFAEGRFTDVDSLLLTGQPMVSNEIEVDVFVDGVRTDHIAFAERDGVTEYELSLIRP